MGAASTAFGNEDFLGFGRSGREANELNPAAGRAPADREEQQAANRARRLTPARGGAAAGLPLALVAALGLVVWASAVRADEGNFRLSGFGTLGLVHHNTDGVQFRRDISEPDGAKAGEWSTAQDSMLGVQMTLQPSDRVEATVQMVSRHAIGVDFKPQVTWAYLKATLAEGLDLRAGRLGIDMYLQGDSAEIGYANLLVRQPLIIYPRTFDGLDAEWTHPLAGGTLRLKGQFGNAVGKLSSGGDATDTGGSPGRFLFAEYAWGSWTGRIAKGRLTLKNELSTRDALALFDALALAPNGAAVKNAVSIKNRRIDYVSAALAYDAGPLQVSALAGSISSPNWSTLRAYSIQAGYRLGKLTPYAAYVLQRSGRDTVATGLPWGLSPATDALNQGAAQAQANVKANQSDVAFGVRYDVSRNTALKLQFDRMRYQDPLSIVDPNLLTVPVDRRSYKSLNLLSVTLDFVF